MSRIGNRILTIPEGVTVELIDNNIVVKGQKGELTFPQPKDIEVNVKDQTVEVKRLKEIKETKQMHGTTNALINNMMIGVSKGYSKVLEIIGVGYRFTPKANVITINAGYSHPVNIDVPKGITVTGISNTEIKLECIDKCALGEFAANIRKVRPPEPYKGKGIRYKDEYVPRKVGKKDK